MNVVFEKVLMFGQKNDLVQAKTRPLKVPTWVIVISNGRVPE